MKQAHRHDKKVANTKRSNNWLKLAIAKIPRNLRIMGVAVVVALLAASGIAYGSGVISDRTRPADKEVTEDLYAIVRSVRAYEAEHHDMPPSLEALSVTLHGDVRDYTYDAKPKDGGPTTTWTLCGTFGSATVDLDPEKLASGQTTLPTWNEDNAEVFTYHRKGNQCYKNDSYKSNSDWGLVLNDDERPALKTAVTDFEKLYANALDDHRAFMQVIGQPVESAPLGKYCVRMYGPRKQVAFNCYLKSRQTFSNITNQDTAKAIMHRLKDTALARGIVHPQLDEKMTEMADGSGQKYSATFAASHHPCRLDVSFSAAWKPSVQYDFFCAAASYSAELPKDFTITDKYDAY